MKINTLNKKTALLFIAVFVLVNLVAAMLFDHLRLDLTDNKLNTLSAGTRNILQNLNETVTLRYYLAEEIIQDLPGLESYAAQVSSFLQEYQHYSNGNLIVEKINPLPFSEQEDEAVSNGIQGAPVSGGGTLYFGLTGQAGPLKKTIPFFQPDREPYLEYDLSQLIYSLTQPERKTIGILSSLPLQGDFIPSQGMTPPVMLVQQLGKQFTVRHLPQSLKTIAEDIDVLMVVKPHGLDEKTLYAIDQYVLKGNPSIVFVDPLSEIVPPGLDEEAQGSTSTDNLLKSWGVEFARDKVVGDPNLAQQVTYRDQFGRTQGGGYLPWLAIGPKQYNEDEMLVNQLGRINVASAGSLSRINGVEVEFTPLIVTSNQAGFIDKDEFSIGVNPARLIANFEPGEEPLILAARVAGVFETAFPEGAPAEAKDETSQEATAGGNSKSDIPEHLSAGDKTSNLIIIADTDFLQDRFWVQIDNFFGQRLAVPNASNLDLVTNALEILSGSPDLISVRSRGSYQRPFELIAEIQKNAELQYRAKEQKLLLKLEETEQKLNALQRQRDDAESAQLTEEQEQEIDKFIAEKIKTRQELRSVQYQLRADIVDLERVIKIFNIGAIPALVALVAFMSWVLRRNRR